MKKWLSQGAVFMLIAAASGLLTRLIVGEYDRSVPCEQASLSAEEVWIDARGVIANKTLVAGAVEISETNVKQDLNRTAQLIFKAANEGKKAVVFCATDSCGSSQFVREQILLNLLHKEVYILHGGWKAYHFNIIITFKLSADDIVCHQ